MATLLTKRSNTAASVPLAAQLTNNGDGAELAVNTADKRLFVKNSGGTVVEVGTNPSTLAIPASLTGTVPIANGGTGQSTANAAFNALAPSQTGNSGRYLSTDGTNTSWVNGGVADGSITTAKLADANVTTAKIADSAITSAKIAAGAVITEDLADSAVTTAKIANANVTVAKLSATGTPSSSTFLRGDGSWQAPAAAAPSTDQVLTATAGASVGAVGTYGFLAPISSTNTSVGGTRAGSGLYWSNGTGSPVSQSSPAGTWRAMGDGRGSQSGCGPTQYYGTLWLRIS